VIMLVSARDQNQIFSFIHDRVETGTKLFLLVGAATVLYILTEAGTGPLPNFFFWPGSEGNRDQSFPFDWGQDPNFSFNWARDQNFSFERSLDGTRIKTFLLTGP
jgi:hypothetical protein